MLILTTFDLDEYVFAAAARETSGLLLKDTPPGDLLAAIRVIAAGDSLHAPSVTRRLIAEFTQGQQSPLRPVRGLGEITGREREVLTMIGRGLSNTQIAAELNVSLSTAKTHVGRLLMKLDARGRPSLSSPPATADWSGRPERHHHCFSKTALSVPATTLS